MGHIHLGVLPKTRAWSDVVDLLTGGASDRAVIAASAVAAEGTLKRAVDDPIFIETVRLLAMIPQAAGDPEFGRALRDLGIPAPDRPDLSDLLTATGTGSTTSPPRAIGTATSANCRAAHCWGRCPRQSGLSCRACSTPTPTTSAGLWRGCAAGRSSPEWRGCSSVT